jgi:sortase A
VLTLAGLALLAYVASQYWSMLHTQRGLQAEWQRQQQQASAPPAAASGSHAPATPLLTRLEIPRISLDAVVVEGDSPRQLLLGPGHIVQTALPGDTGNSVIAGHRDTFFRHIFELNQGDEIIVQRSGQSFRYEVTGKKVVKPEDVSVLRPTPDAELTLITCYPTYYLGPAPERLVVFSKLLAAPRSD